MLGITLGVSDRSKPGVDKVSGLVLSGGYYGVTWVGNLESAGPGEGEPLNNPEGTRVGNKLGISDGEVLGIILGVASRSKLGGDKLSGQILSGGKVEGRLLIDLFQPNTDLFSTCALI